MKHINSNSNHGSFIKKPATGKLYFAVPTQDELKVAQAHASFQNFMCGLRKALSVGALTVAAVVVSFGALKGCADEVDRSAVVGEAQ